MQLAKWFFYQKSLVRKSGREFGSKTTTAAAPPGKFLRRGKILKTEKIEGKNNLIGDGRAANATDAAGG